MRRIGLWADVSDARRRVMRAVKGKDTKPELLVRRMIYSAGYRYRLHRKDLPGKPDLAFGFRRKAIFVHGCFWHSHFDGVCKAASVPKAHSEYWSAKLEANRARDSAHLRALADMGWQTMVIWECSLRDEPSVLRAIVAFLGPAQGIHEL